MENKCPREDFLANSRCMEPSYEIRKVVSRMQRGDSMKTTELIYLLKPSLGDGGEMLLKVLKGNLISFGSSLNDIVESRIQDERDVMLHTQTVLSKKLLLSTHNLENRMATIVEKLFTISPSFNWKIDGKDESLVSTLITVKNKNYINPRLRSGGAGSTHGLVVRSQWMKRQWYCLQHQNKNLEDFYQKAKNHAIEKRSESIRVPQMLTKEFKILEDHLKRLKRTYMTNMEKIHLLYVQNNLRF